MFASFECKAPALSVDALREGSEPEIVIGTYPASLTGETPECFLCRQGRSECCSFCGAAAGYGSMRDLLR
jgi:hypothetical protein